MVGTSVRPLAGWLAASQSPNVTKKKKRPQNQLDRPLAADDTLDGKHYGEAFRPGEGSWHVGHLLEALSGSDEG